MVRTGRRWLLCTLLVAAGLACREAQGAQDDRPEEEVFRLVKLLESKDANVRLAAAALLGDLAESAGSQRIDDLAKTPLPALRETAAPELAKLASDTNPQLRRMAVLALGKVRAAGLVAAPVWQKALMDHDASVRRAVPQALVLYFTREAEFSTLKSPSAQLVFAAQLLHDVAETRMPVQASLRSDDSDMVKHTLEALLALTESLELTPDVPEDDAAPFREVLPKAAESVRSFLASAVAVVGHPPTDNQRLAAGFIEQVARLCDPRPDIEIARPGEPKRVRGRMARSNLGTEGEAALKLLKDGLKDALPTLIWLVNQPPLCVQLAILDALEVMGPEALPAVPALREALCNSDRFIRWAAARTLAKIGPGEDNLATVLGLAELVKDEDLDVAAAACHFIADPFAQEAAPAVPVISWAARSQERELQYAAVQALAKIVGAIKGEAREAVPGLLAALKSTDLKTRQAVPPILGQLGPEAAAALPALREALDDPNLEVRQAAAQAILRISGQ